MRFRDFLRLYTLSAILGGLSFWPAACFSSHEIAPRPASDPLQAVSPADEVGAMHPAESARAAQSDGRKSESAQDASLGLAGAGLTPEKDPGLAVCSSDLVLSNSGRRNCEPVWTGELRSSTVRVGRRQGVRSVPPPQTSDYLREAAGGHSLMYEVTAYSHGCTLPRSGRETTPQRAANGRWPIADLTVAADTRIHPLGSEVLIEGLGFRLVHDRGAAIVGRRLDLFLDSCREARRFGRQWLRVYAVPRETTLEARR